jgi:branched-chain amino acid aminotransferase
MHGVDAVGRVVYVNGELVPEVEAKISIYDSALMFGDMVFEMTRSFNKQQFRLREHLERLYASMRFVHIAPPMSIEEMGAKCLEVVEANEPSFLEHDEHRLVINVSRGPLAIYASVFGGRLEPTVVIADFPLKWTVGSMGHLFDTGINLVIASQRAIPAHLMDPKVKSRSRLHYMMANAEVSHWPGDNNWALLLDPDGFVAEGTGDNFFLVRDQVVVSPEPRNILRGISRAYVLELAAELGMRTEERNLEPYDVLAADEAFVTGTPFCMLPVSSLNGISIGDGRRGPVFDRLLELWSANVDLDIEGQLRAYEQEVGDRGPAGATPYQLRR